ncbi:MAG: hypothetical protein KAY46_19460 [Burkholderiaceae bacterium]|nr:hypothetical protein [Burkholderiaceae bacterium]
MSSATTTSNSKALTDSEQSMARALSTLLNQTRDARRAWPHLSALEISLSRNGLNCVEQASLAVLIKVSQQLASVPDGRNDPNLCALQEALLRSMARKRPVPAHAQLEDLGGGGFVEVSEITHSAFMAIANAAPALPRSAEAAVGSPAEHAGQSPAFPVFEGDSPAVPGGSPVKVGAPVAPCDLTWRDSIGELPPVEPEMAATPGERTQPMVAWEPTRPMGAPGT